MIARSVVRYFTAFGGTLLGAHAVDIGCGEGRDTIFLALSGVQVAATDVAPTGLAKLREWAETLGVDTQLIHFVNRSVVDATLEPDSVEIAIAANIFQFLNINDVPGQIERLKATVRTGGVIGIGVFHPRMKDWGAKVEEHYCATADQLAEFFQESSGWHVVDRTEYTTYNVTAQSDASFSFVVAHRYL